MWRLKYHASIPQFEPSKVHPNTFPLIHKYNPLQKCNDDVTPKSCTWKIQFLGVTSRLTERCPNPHKLNPYLLKIISRFFLLDHGLIGIQ